MSEETPISAKIAMDTTDFKSGVSILNRDIRILESEFRASAAALGDWSKSSQGLELRISTLSKEIADQEELVRGLTKEQQRLAEKEGATSYSAEEMQIRVNKQTLALNKMKSELNQTQTELGQTDSATDKAASGMNNLETQTKQTHQAMSGLKNMLSTMGGVIAGIGLTSLAGAAIQAVSGLGRLVFGTIEGADALDELSQKTGISTTKLQEMGYIGKIAGVDIDTMSGSLSKMIRSMDAAATTPAGQAFKELGISTRDTSGNLLDSQVVFENTIEALGKVQNETERDALAMQIFGRSALDLNPLIILGADGMAKMADEAHKVGAVMSSENVKASADLNDKIDSLKLGAMGLVGTLASALAPGLQTVTDGMSGLLQGVTGVIKGFQQSPEVGQKMLGDLISNITDQIPGLLATGLKIVQGLINGLLQALPVMMPMAVKIITQLVTFIVQALPMLIEAAGQIVIELVRAIVPLLPALVEAGIQVIVELINGISQALPELMPMIAQVIAEISRILAQNMPVLIEAGIQLLTAIIQGLSLAMPILAQQIPVIIQTLIDAFVLAWPRIQEMGLQLLAQFAQGILSGVVAIVTPIGKLILEPVVTAITDNLHIIKTVGAAMVDGIWQGIQSKANELRQKLINWMLDMIGAAKRAIGFGSPAKEFIIIGESMAQGLGVGFANQIKAVEKGIAGTMGGLGANGMTLAGSSSYSTQTVYNFGPVYYGGNGSQGNNQNNDQVLRY